MKKHLLLSKKICLIINLFNLINLPVYNPYKRIKRAQILFYLKWDNINYLLFSYIHCFIKILHITFVYALRPGLPSCLLPINNPLHETKC